MRLWIVSLFILSSSFSFAEAVKQNVHFDEPVAIAAWTEPNYPVKKQKVRTEAVAAQIPCQECSKNKEENVTDISAVSTVIENQGSDLRSESVQLTAGQELLLKLKERKKQPMACYKFVDSKNQLGMTGKIILDILSRPEYKNYYTKNDSLKAYCPKFNSLEESEKLLAWTWFWSVLAKEEATCNEKINHPTHYRDKKGRKRVLNPTVGYGLWALEKDRNKRRWRGAACENIGSVEGQARCAIDIMVKTQFMRGRNVSYSGSYWGPVRRAEKQIIPGMKGLESCY